MDHVSTYYCIKNKSTLISYHRAGVIFPMRRALSELEKAAIIATIIERWYRAIRSKHRQFGIRSNPGVVEHVTRNILINYSDDIFLSPIKYAYDLETIGISRSTTLRIIHNLEEKGFVAIRQIDDSKTNVVVPLPIFIEQGEKLAETLINLFEANGINLTLRASKKNAK